MDENMAFQLGHHFSRGKLGVSSISLLLPMRTDDDVLQADVPWRLQEGAWEIVHEDYIRGASEL
ncbi:hypothetical protein ATN79_43005 [Paraburkholderia caribensis]|nr:hypothetical protein ATN79_43005 [Paraburkholderia caribensis]